MHRAQKGHRPVAAVVHQQQHAFLALDAQAAQAGGQAPHTVFQRAVAQAAVVVDEGGLGGAACIAPQQVLREVEALGQGRQRGRGHGVVSIG